MTRALQDFDYMQLLPTDRLRLAYDILDSVLSDTATGPLTAAQLAELDRRCHDIDNRAVSCIPWNDVRDRFLNGG